ncbi:MAG: aminopeptidase P family protein [Chitinophagaceae bacterium]|nr:aminopeptidase P family protein [Anaerolineae bacterium]
MHQQQRQKTIDMLKSKGVERALFAHLDSVKWLTGFAPPIQLGLNLFAGGPSLVWYEDGHFTLIVLDYQQPEAAFFEQESDGSVVTYTGYNIDEPVKAVENLGEVLRGLFEKSASTPGKIGVETRHLTAYLYEALRMTFSANGEVVHSDNWLMPLRMIKTDEEIAKLRRNFQLTDLGHKVAGEIVQPGLREIDIWTAMHSAIQREVGARVALGNDCVVGERQNNIGGWPLDYPITPNGSLIVDLSTNYQGYWSDSCATYYAADLTLRQKTMRQDALNALDYAISLIRPGIKANDVDQKMRQFIADAGYPVYPHHSGHGIGVSPHEAPRIVPYNEEILEVGMVIMLEPGIYFPTETGVRFEDGLLITPDGVEILTTHLPR